MNASYQKMSPAVVRRSVRFFTISLLAAVSLCFVGCETTGVATGASPKAGDVVKVGMSKAEVLAILGDPADVEQVPNETIEVEIWRYENEKVVSSTIESDGEQERVYADPETGQMVTVREPIYRNEKIKALITVEFLFNGDELIAMKEKVDDGQLEVGGR